VPKSANTDYKSALTHGKATGGCVQQFADIQLPIENNSAFTLKQSSSKQLIYLKIKPAVFSSEQFWHFKDHGPIQSELLSQLAAIPLLKQTQAFTPSNLQFALSKHYSKDGRKTKGHYFTLGFTPTHDSNIDIPTLILQAQKMQDKSYFTFHLTATSQKGPQVVKAKLSFARNLEDLADKFQLEFQVRIPLVIHLSPEHDFATLVFEILFPTSGNATLTTPAPTQFQRLAEIERIQSFCNPIKHSSSEHGILVNRLMTGKFPLNLEDSESRDVAICNRLIFAALYGLDLRPRHQERYVLILPILSDPAQVDRCPSVFRSILSTLKDSFAKSGITPAKSMLKSGGDASSSESEAEELFLARVEARATALILLPVVQSIQSNQSLEFPRLSAITSEPLKLAEFDAALCKHFLQGRCNKAKIVNMSMKFSLTHSSRQPHTARA
jgi:hypothetical protein